MKRSILFVICMVGLPSYASAQTATEKAEKCLSELLAPGSPKAAPFADRPATWRASRTLDDFSLPITPYAGVPVRLTQAPVKSVKPRSAPEATPLVAYREESAAPILVQLPTKPLLKVPSVDVNVPLPIPMLAQPTKDRASLAEPAFDVSLEATLKKITPTRDKPVPFTPLNLPDPFEYLRYGQLRNPPEESATPPVIPLQRPTK
jgi:hypothetical protein